MMECRKYMSPSTACHVAGGTILGQIVVVPSITHVALLSNELTKRISLYVRIGASGIVMILIRMNI